MDAIQGAGGVHSEQSPFTHAATGTKPRSGSAPSGSDTQPETAAALSQSREYIRSSLQACGFVDICARSVATTHEVAETDVAAQDGMDAHAAGEIAAQFGQQIASSSIDQILELVSRPDPGYALKLLV